MRHRALAANVADEGVIASYVALSVEFGKVADIGNPFCVSDQIR